MNSDLMVLLPLAWESLNFSKPAGWGTICYTYQAAAEVGWVSPSEVFATVVESGTYQAAGLRGLKMTAELWLALLELGRLSVDKEKHKTTLLVGFRIEMQ